MAEAMAAPAAPESDRVAALRRRLESRPVRWVGGAVLLGLAFALPLLRQEGSRSWSTIWAEDGGLYGPEALFYGPKVLFDSYNGYLQWPSRLLALPLPLIPTHQFARYFAASAALWSALLAWFVYWVTAPWISSKPVRLALASLIVLMPVLVDEITANITNTIWPTMAVLPWALLSTRDRPREVAVPSVVAAVGAMSSAITVIFVPLAIAVAALRRRVSTWVTVGCYFFGLGVQALVIRSAPVSPDRQGNDLGDLVYHTSTRTFGVFLVGYRGISDLWDASAFAATVGVTVVVLGLYAVVFPGAGRRAQKISLVLLGYGLLAFLFPVAGRGTEAISQVSLDPIQGGSRFSVIPVFLFASAFAVLLAPIGVNRDRTIAKVGRVVLVAQIALLALLEFSEENARTKTPPYPEAVDLTYEEECVGQPPDAQVNVPISPEPWGFVMECQRLLE